MVEKRVLTNKLIREILLNYYNINETKITLIKGGSAELYNINNKYVIKLYQTKYSKNDIIDEINVINYLRNKKFIVPTLVKNNFGNYYYEVKNRCLVVQEYISGTCYDKFLGTKSMIQECGFIHGKLVKELIDYPTNKKDNVYEWCDLSALKSAKDKFNKIINIDNDQKVTRDLQDKIKMIDSFNEELTGLENISYYTSHGDFSYLQFIYDDDKVKAIIDFIRVKKLPIIWEIMRSYSYIDLCASNAIINIDNLVLYVKEFMKNTKLTREDLRLMPYVYLCQLLRSSYGYKEYLNTGNEELLDFGHYRTELCKYLFEHVKEISERLVSIYE